MDRSLEFDRKKLVLTLLILWSELPLALHSAVISDMI